MAKPPFKLWLIASAPGSGVNTTVVEFSKMQMADDAVTEVKRHNDTEDGPHTVEAIKLYDDSEIDESEDG